MANSMADDPNSATTVTLQYVVDQSSESDLLASTDKVSKNISGIADANAAVGASADQIGQIGTQAKTASDDAETLDTTLKSIGNTNLGGVTSGLSALSRLANTAGLKDVGAGLRVSDEISRVVNDLPKLTDGIASIGNAIAQSGGIFTSVSNDAAGLVASLSATGAPLTATTTGLVSFAAVIGPAVLALGAIGIGVANFEATISDAKQGLDEAVKSVDAYYEAIKTGTTQSIQAKLQELQLDEDINTQKLKNLQAPQVINNWYDPIKNLIANISDPSLVDDIKKTQAAVTDDQATIDGFTRALQSNQVAANNAAAQLDKMVSVQAQKNQDEIQNLELIKSGTAQQVQDELNKNQIEQQANNDTIAYLKSLAEVTPDPAESQKLQDAIQGYQDKNAALSYEYDQLSGTVLPAVQKHSL